MKNKVDMADICELAHELTVRDCQRLKIRLEYIAKNKDVRYTEKAQDIFNNYYDLITNTLKV